MKPSKNSKLAQLLRNMVPEEEIRKELVQILTDANNSLLEKDQLIKTKTTINKNLAKIEQEFLNQQIDIGLVEPRFDSIASSLRAWLKPKWLLINKSDSVYEKATEYYQNHKEIKKMQADTRGIYFESSILEDQMDIDAEVSSSGVAVLSFTNVASNEIQEKAQTIHGSLGELGYPHFIGTVDSFIDEFIVLRYGHLDTVSNVRPRITITDTWKMPYGFWRKECHSKGCIDNIEQFYYGIDKKFYKGNEPVKCEKRNARSLPCQQYKKMLQDRGIIFQNETALFAYQLLKKYPMVASAIAERFPVIIIDEAQDTSVNQMAVFDLLSKSGVKSMFLVGDADQSIYEWRNASPECFLQKVEDTSWQTIELTGNFRSSQNICNVTSYFSASLRGTKSNNAIGYWKDEVQKPILLLTKNNSENDTIDYFIKKCMEMQIGISPKNVAVLTRGRIYSDTDIKGLWKSAEIELYAKAAYEWKYGSRKKAYENTEKATYCMIFNEDTDKYMMQQKIREHTTEESWKDFIINILINMPDVDMEIAEWVKEFSTIFVDVCKNCEYKISPDKEIKDTFKIKRNDNKSPDFKKISLKKFFEKKNEEKYTRSSIHGVKGESYEAVLLHVKSRTGSTITPKLLMEGELEQELMRLAYVAMTRPRRLLMLAMPDTKGIKTCGRFSEELWTYENL